MKRFKMTFFAAIAFFIVLGATEIVLRIAHVAEWNPLYTTRGLKAEPDPYRFWKLSNDEIRMASGQCKVVCLADSVTVMSQRRGYPDLLSVKATERGGPALSVFNAGVPEYTSYQGRVYLEREIARTKPEIVTIHFGWNDHADSPSRMTDRQRGKVSPRLFLIYQFANSSRIFRLIGSAAASARKPSVRVTPDEYRKNLVAMVKLVRSWGGMPILVTAPAVESGEDWVPIHRRYQIITRDTAAKEKTMLLDLARAFGQRKELFLDPTSDACHFSREGDDLAAGLLADLIVANELCGKN